LATRALIIGWAAKAAWFSAFWYVYGGPSRLFAARIDTLLFVLLAGIIAMMSTGWIIAQTHRLHCRPMVLLYILLELIAPPITFISAGASVMHWRPLPPLVIYGWGPPLFQVIAGIQEHLGIIDSVAATLVGGITMVVSVLVGGGFFRNKAESNSADHQPATV
jgi:hypothetical protein